MNKFDIFNVYFNFFLNNHKNYLELKYNWDMESNSPLGQNSFVFEKKKKI